MVGREVKQSSYAKATEDKGKEKGKMQVNITLRKLENPKPGVPSVYAAGVQHDATLNVDECAPSIAAYLKVTPVQFKTAWKALAGGLKRQAKLGNQSTVDGAFRVGDFVRGWFETLTSPWNKARNFLQVNATAIDPLKSALGDVTVVNRTEGAKPSIDSVLDTLTGQYDEVKVGDPLYVAGKDISIDTSKADEFVALRNKKTGALVKGTVTRSDNQTIDCSFDDVAVEPGEYVFVVQTRSGLGDDFGVATATRGVRVVG